MILYPAIDIRDGKAVRLRQGDFADETVYDADPLDAAKRWVDQGARYLHVIDLDGARAGKPANLHHVERIAREAGVPIQVGGGLRTLPDVRDALRAGATRVILGTAAYTDIDFLDDVLHAFENRVLVSVDVRDGRLAAAGWTEQTQMLADSVILRLQQRGVRAFVYSNIERDGMLEGPDLDEARHVAETVRGRFIYSGGIGSLEHLEALVALRQVNLTGVIVGKALYEGRFTVAEAQAVVDRA
ncbi:MAG: phosphoribosylformimino-5-aminoimidazole carboxamide ribotide isomerase [Solirubrobacterales bacterium]|nr:phosphoribosylformimino-5-aminoimidazole carboxamide ribotide isomerase [Solirubrobacterales bacterium]